MRTLSYGLWGILSISIFCWGAHGSSQERVAKQSSEESKFKIDRGLLDEIYRSEVQSIQTETRHSSGSLEISPQLSYVTPSSFELNNDYFKVPYSESGATFPLVQLSVATPITFWGSVEVYGQARIGYSFREASQQVRSQSGLLLSDVVTVHWLPISASVRTAYRIPGFSAVKPFLTLGGGAQWLQQSGKLDGITQNFWIPFYFASGGLTLFDRSDQGSHWFGGVTLGATMSRSMGSAQVLNYWALDLGTTFLL